MCFVSKNKITNKHIWLSTLKVFPHFQVSNAMRRRWRLEGKLQSEWDRGIFKRHKLNQKRIAQGCKATWIQWVECHDRTLLPLEHSWNNNFPLLVNWCGIRVHLLLINPFLNYRAEGKLLKSLLMGSLPAFLLSCVSSLHPLSLGLCFLVAPVSASAGSHEHQTNSLKTLESLQNWNANKAQL